MTATELELSALQQLKIYGLPEPETQYRFHPVRRWKFDGAYPEYKIAYEVEGGTWSGGRHTRGSGFRGDCEKYNQAVLLGWKVFRFTSDMINDGLMAITLDEALREVGLL